MGIFFLGLQLISSQYSAFLHDRKIENAGSDIIPIIQVACRRLLAGEFPYKMVSDFGFDQDMTYLPLHWMPMCISRIMGIDDRWIPYSVWALAALVITIRAARIPNPIYKALVPLFLLLSLTVLFYRDPGIVECTVELMIAGYYMLLVCGFNTGNAWFQGIMLGCCLLSRYTVLLWLPLYAVVLLSSGHKKQFFIAAGVASAMVLLIYVLPFLTRDPGLFYNGYKYYDRAALFEWTHLNKEGKPIHVFSGSGFAYWFYTSFAHYDVSVRIKLLQKTHIVTCLLVTAGMAAWYYRQRHKVNYRLFLMGSFKIYLAFFLFLIQVPYAYS